MWSLSELPFEITSTFYSDLLSLWIFFLFSSYTRTQEDMRSAWNEIGRQVTRQLLSRITRKSGRLLWNGAPDATIALQVTSGLFSGSPSRFSRFMRGSVATPWQSFPVAGHAVTLPSYLSATIETTISGVTSLWRYRQVAVTSNRSESHYQKHVVWSFTLWGFNGIYLRGVLHSGVISVAGYLFCRKCSRFTVFTQLWYLILPFVLRS